MAILNEKRFYFKDDKGLASVEMAIVSLVLVLLTFGGMEYGWLFFRMQELSNVSREASRIAVLPTSTTASVTTRVTALMTGFGMESSSYTVTISPAEVSSASAQDPIQVTISVPYGNVGLTGMAIIPTPTTLSSSATMAREGP